VKSIIILTFTVFFRESVVSRVKFNIY